MVRRIARRREKRFPNLVASGYKKTSDETSTYNCLAWAVGDTTKWWQPNSVEPGHWWPPLAPAGPQVEIYAQALETLRFKRCQKPRWEKGVLTIALFTKPNGHFAHAAKLLANGKWSSKLGDWEDITHNTLAALESDGTREAYGKVAIYLRKRIR